MQDTFLLFYCYFFLCMQLYIFPIIIMIIIKMNYYYYAILIWPVYKNNTIV